MAIRVSGLNSGLDTDSIVEALVSAYATKKEKYEKALQKQEWTMDAWKTTNSKVYSFYSGSLSQMRYSTNYSLKKSSISNSNVASVTASSTAVSGTQSLSVAKLATSGYLTGSKLTDSDGATYAADTKLSDLGISGGTLKVNDTEIELKGSMSFTALTSKLKEAGVNANYDADNGRFFISSKSSGAANEFTLVGTDEDGVGALKALGLFKPTETEQAYYTENGISTGSYSGTALDKFYESVNSLIDEAQASIDTLQASIDELNTKISEKDAEAAEKFASYTAEDATDEAAGYADWEAYLDYLTGIDEAEDQELTDVQKERLSELKAYRTSIQASQTQIDDKNAEITDAQDQITKYQNYLTMDADAIAADEDAAAIYASAESFVNASAKSESSGASRIVGQDSLIYLNGAEFTGTTNTFSINGLTIEATATTNPVVDENGEFVSDDSAVTISTAVDSQGIYDKIKEFLKSYNEMVEYIDTLYYADSASGYEPLTDDEKEAMTDTQIEQWEKKIKDALLRKDSTLGDLSTSMKSAILSTQYTNKDGKTYSLSTLGIATMSYFSAEDYQRGTFHIDGDSDDSSTSGNEDKLLKAIANDPDSVVEFFQKLSSNLYTAITNKMASSSLSSAFTIYNDKQMSSQYSDYEDKIDDWDEKLTDYEDYYYSKFTAMEKALATLNSNSSSLSSLMG